MFHTRRLRWYIGALLFLSTVVNYMDRQTLSVLAPILTQEYSWTNTDYAMIIIAFRVAYSMASLDGALPRPRRHEGRPQFDSHALFGRRDAHVPGDRLRSFAAFRFMLGLGEAANWPGATKAVSEWFPRRESGWAVALFDSGSSIGAAVGPLLVLWLYHTFGTWRPVFVIIGSFGFLWLLLFRWVYHSPETHPWISPEERKEILADREADQPAVDEARPVITYSGC
jgi:ACS family hexuronate transporter-like MFS transporter